MRESIPLPLDGQKEYLPYPQYPLLLHVRGVEEPPYQFGRKPEAVRTIIKPFTEVKSQASAKAMEIVKKIAVRE